MIRDSSDVSMHRVLPFFLGFVVYMYVGKSSVMIVSASPFKVSAGLTRISHWI